MTTSTDTAPRRATSTDLLVIDVRRMRKTYADKAVLDGVDLEVGPGEIVGFVGPNGAGKTTCLRSLVGLVRPDEGHVEVLGHDPRHDSLAVRRGCSYLPGETSVYREMNVQSFLAFALKFHRARHTDLITDMLRRFDLPMRRPVQALSAGMKQKLALIATLGPDVPLYVLDEPDRALDHSVRLLLRELLDELRSRGHSVLLSSHHLAEVEAICDRTAFILSGRTVRDDEVTAAQRELQGRLRLRSIGGFDIHAHLPPGARARTTIDETVEIVGLDDPIGFVASLPRDAIASVELGVTRLEDLDRELMR